MTRFHLSKTPTSVLVLVMLALGLGLGVLIGNAGFGTQQPAVAADQAPPDTVKYPLSTNDRGQTYGSLIGREESPDHPDLVAAYGDNGKQGYVYYNDLVSPNPKNEEEMLALNAKATQEVVIPLYLSDGVTQIGTYTINKGAVTTEG